MRISLGFVLAVALAAVLLAETPPAEAHRPGAYWPYRKLMRKLDGKAIRVGRRKVRLDASTATCLGVGRGIRRRGVRRWKHFNCTQPTFPPGAIVGPDVLFRVHALDRRRLVITNAHFTRY
jgi:hypothetical protein